MHHIPAIAALMIFATPALAMDAEQIGMLTATFGDVQIAQPTVILQDDGKDSSTAYLLQVGGGISALNFFGYMADNSRLDVSMTYMVDVPDATSAPIDMTIDYTAASAGGSRWTSDEAPTPPTITFTTLDFDGATGQAIGRFAGVLCFAETYGSEPDTGNCRPIEGTVDTRFVLEQP